MSTNRKQKAYLMPKYKHYEECMEKRLWGVFVGISLGCFFGGIIIILLYRILIRVIVYLQNKPTTSDPLHSDPYITNASTNEKKDETDLNLLNKNNRFSSSTLEKYDQQSINTTITNNTTQNKSISSRCCSQWWTSIQFGLVKGRWWAIRLVSYDWIPGRIFIALSMIFSLTSFSIYAYEATVWPLEIEKCGHKGRRLRLLDFTVNIFFLMHFIVRLIASSDALLFWIEWYSILDYLTVPPTLVGFFIKRTWIGFRFVRIFRLCNLPEVLNNLNVIKSASSLRMCQLCTLFISIWFAGAGCFNLFENTGNLFGPNAYNVSQPLPYTASLYFTIVTMSTVGYGDIVPQTHLGRVFISLFILFALATFASAIPEIVDMFFNVSKYSGVYNKREGKSHIIVCGDITTDSVRTFLNDFLHEDRQISDVEVVFINRSKPDLQLENLLRLHFLRVKYFRGTVMDYADLQRVKMESADACLILASATTADPYQTDAENIMRVIAVKNFASHVRVIVQLLQTENKAYLLNSPYWNWDGGDEIVCFSELKLGFLAQSCIAPGFSTLVTNLFTMHSIRGLKEAAKFAKIYVTPRPKVKKRVINKSPSTQMNVLASNSNATTTPTTNNTVVLRKSPTSTRPLTESRHSSNIPTFEKDNRKVVKWLHKIPRMITSLFKAKDASGIHLSTTTDSRPHSMQYTSPTTSKLLDTESTVGYNTTTNSSLLESDNWVYNYLQGASMEIYSAKFSMAFDGLHFTDAAILCRRYLDLLLIAVVAKIPENKDPQSMSSRISGDFASPGDNHNNFHLQDNDNDEHVDDDDEGGENSPSEGYTDEDDNGDNEEDEDMNENKYYLAVSPTLDKNVIINYGTVGFFICDSQEHANKVSFYCLTCHVNNSLHKQYPAANIKPCSCQLKSQKSNLKIRASALFKLKKDTYHNQQLTKLNKTDKEMAGDLNLCPMIPELEESEKTPPTTNISLSVPEKEIEFTAEEVKPTNAMMLRKHDQEKESTTATTTMMKNRTLSRRNSLLSAYDTEEHYYDEKNETQPRRLSDTDIQARMSVISPTNEFDITGMYYYCKYQKFEDKLITSSTTSSSTSTSINKSRDLYNHILVCILAESDAPLLGLHSFVMPLRASNYHSSQLRTIVFLGDKKFLQREWCNIANFPKVYTLAGSPLSRTDLRAARIQYSSVCVILSSRGTIKLDDPYMLDKEVILCTLNIRAMKFSTFCRCNLFPQNSKRRSGAEIPLITELMTDNNIHYLDPDNSGGVQITASLTAPFARGIAFTSSVLDVLASTAYFDRNSMTLIRHLVTGGVTPALEQWLAEGGGLIGFHDWEIKGKRSLTKKIQKKRVSFLFPGLYETRQRPRVEQIPLTDPRLTQPPTDDDDVNNNNNNKRLFRCYGDLFCHAIREHGILCLGIYRLSFNTYDIPSRLVTVPSSLKLDANSINETSKNFKESTKGPSSPNDNQRLWNSEYGVPPRRLSTCALPVDRMLRKHSLQVNRKSLSVEENSPESIDEQGHLQQQQQQQRGEGDKNKRQGNRNIPQKTTSSKVTSQHFVHGGVSRYVISNPPNHFQLYPSDLIFCLCPFECTIPI